MAISKNNLLLYGAIGAGVYYAYKKGWFKKITNKPPVQPPPGSTPPINPVQPPVVNNPNSIENPNSYRGKVARLQSALAVAIDGIAGPQTNGAYIKQVGPLFRGPINPANIDGYLIQAQQKFPALNLAIVTVR